MFSGGQNGELGRKGLAVNYFRKVVPSEMFEWILNAPLEYLSDKFSLPIYLNRAKSLRNFLSQFTTTYM